jgi:hypothetical protein
VLGGKTLDEVRKKKMQQRKIVMKELVFLPSLGMIYL